MASFVSWENWVSKKEASRSINWKWGEPWRMLLRVLVADEALKLTPSTSFQIKVAANPNLSFSVVALRPPSLFKIWFVITKEEGAALFAIVYNCTAFSTCRRWDSGIWSIVINLEVSFAFLKPWRVVLECAWRVVLECGCWMWMLTVGLGCCGPWSLCVWDALRASGTSPALSAMWGRWLGGSGLELSCVWATHGTCALSPAAVDCVDIVKYSTKLWKKPVKVLFGGCPSGLSNEEESDQQYIRCTKSLRSPFYCTALTTIFVTLSSLLCHCSSLRKDQGSRGDWSLGWDLWAYGFITLLRFQQYAKSGVVRLPWHNGGVVANQVDQRGISSWSAWNHISWPTWVYSTARLGVLY